MSVYTKAIFIKMFYKLLNVLHGIVIDDNYVSIVIPTSIDVNYRVITLILKKW